VDFYDGLNLIGTSNISPFSIPWSNAASGTHYLKAVAEDARGVTGTSDPITVKVSKSLNGVRNNKRSASTRTTPGSAVTTLQADSLDSIASSLEQTYYDFNNERDMFNSATKIDKSLFAALLLARSSAALARQSASSAVDDRLDKLDAYLSICEDLMVSDAMSNSTMIHANQANASPDLRITQPVATQMTSSGIVLQPNAPAKLVVASTTPFTTQMISSSTGSYELAGVSASINGQAVSLTSVSPNQITFLVPSILGGLGDVVVTSREGYISHGTTAINGLNPVIFRWFGDSNDRGAILDAVSFQSTISTTSNGLFDLDGKSRISIWASGITTGIANVSTNNDVVLADGHILQNVAEEILVEARLADGRSFLLRAEYAGPQGSITGLDQINVVLLPELRGAGNVQLTILVGNVRSNTMGIVVQ